MDNIDSSQAFLNHKSIAGVEYQHNDYVRVIDGPHQGKTGSLVWLFAIETEPEFLVELEIGGGRNPTTAVATLLDQPRQLVAGAAFGREQKLQEVPIRPGADVRTAKENEGKCESLIIQS